MEAEYSYVNNDGPIFYLQTNLNAPRNRLISVDIMNPKSVFYFFLKNFKIFPLGHFRNYSTIRSRFDLGFLRQ